MNIKQHIIRVLTLFLITASLVSCEKEITLKFDEHEDKYVIEGTITDQPGVCSVLISKTKNFTDNNQFNGVSGATVSIENQGKTIVLPEISQGVYSTTGINGTPGQTYTLKVEVNGSKFTASSTMPEAVPFLDFYMKPKDFDSLRTIAYVKYKDPADLQNFYWFELFINDKKQANFSLANDDFTTGQEVNSSVIFENKTKVLSKNIKRGDKLSVEMHSIDPSVYLYLFGLGGAKGSGNGTTPANPQSNISGGALGFFSAHTTQRKNLVIP